MAIFGPKPWVNPFGKTSIFGHFELLVFKAQEGVFSFQNIVKDIFLTYIAKKKRLEKWPYLDQNHGKTSISRHFELLVFMAKKGVFSFQNIVKVIFLTNIALKKRLEKWPYQDQNHGLTPLEKPQFFDILNFLFLQPRKAFFLSIIS